MILPMYKIKGKWSDMGLLARLTPTIVNLSRISFTDRNLSVRVIMEGILLSD